MYICVIGLEIIKPVCYMNIVACPKNNRVYVCMNRSYLRLFLTAYRVYLCITLNVCQIDM